MQVHPGPLKQSPVGWRRGNREERLGKNQVFLHQEPKNALFFIYVIVIIDEHKIMSIFPLQSPQLICNIRENDVAAGARSNYRLQPIGPSGLRTPLILPRENS
jgi:hypothetical protein